MLHNRKFDQKKFDDNMKEWEWNWINGHETYITEPKGDAVKMSMKMHKKYYNQIVKAYSSEETFK